MWVGDAQPHLRAVELSRRQPPVQARLPALAARHHRQLARSRPSGNYALMFDTVNGVPQHAGCSSRPPTRRSSPTTGTTCTRGYLADQWRVGQRLTLQPRRALRLPALATCPSRRAKRAVGGPADDLPARRGRQVDPYRAARGRRLGRDRPRQDGGEGLVRHGSTPKAAISGELQPVHDLHHRLPVARPEPRRPLPAGRGQPRHDNGLDFISTTSAANNAHQLRSAALARAAR